MFPRLTSAQRNFVRISIPLLIQIYVSFFFSLARFSYTGFMVQELLPHLALAEVGYYAGLLIGSFYVGQAVNGICIGYLSDRFGVNTMLGVCDVGGIIFPIAYGLASDFTLAVVYSFLYGCVNGTPSLVKASMHQRLSHVESQYGLSYINAFKGAASLSGHLVAGSLCYPARTYTWLDFALLRDHPFLLPNVISALFNVFGLMALMHEIRAEWCGGGSSGNGSSTSTISGGGIHPTSSSSTSGNDITGGVYNTTHTNTAINNHSSATSSGGGSAVSTGRHCTVIAMSDHHHHHHHHHHSTSKNTWTYLCHNKTQVILVLIIYGWLNANYLIIDTLIPLLLMLPISSGGFGLNTEGVALVLIVLAIGQIVCSILAPRVTTRFGLKRSLLYCLLYGSPILMLLPLFAYIPIYPLNLMLMTMWMLVSVTFNFQVSSLASNSLLNHVSDPQYIVQMNGISLSVASVSRFVGPSICGALFAWSSSSKLSYPFNQHFVFIVYGIFSALLALMVIRLRSSGEPKDTSSDDPSMDDDGVQEMDSLASTIDEEAPMKAGK